MPPKRKLQGIGAKYNAAKKAKTKKTSSNPYGTGWKKSDKYGGKGMEALLYEAERRAKSAVQKEVNKNIETQYSQAMVTMTHTPDKQRVGWDLCGLNLNGTRFDPDQAMVFNLGYLSQQGSALTPGYRIGQRINCKHIRVVVSGNLPQISSDCTYKWRIIRRKTDQPGQLAYASPTLTSMTSLELFKPLTDGPFAASSQYGEEGSAQNPFPYFSSANRQNTEHWTFCQGGLGSKYMKGHPITVDTDENTTEDQKYVASFCESMYFTIDNEWEFVSRTGSDIKGGNYFFVLWREGGPDFTQYSSDPHLLAQLGHMQLKVFFELAYKDG